MERWECVSESWARHPWRKPLFEAQGGGGPVGNQGLVFIKEQHASPCHTAPALINGVVRCCGSAVEGVAELPTVHHGLEHNGYFSRYEIAL